MTAYPQSIPPQRGSSITSWILGVVLVLLVVGATVAALLLTVARDHRAREGAAATTSGLSGGPPDYETIERTARETTVAVLTYEPDTARQTLVAARDRLTGDFRDSYADLTDTVVIPGAEGRRISATATVPALGVTEADDAAATVLVFVDQSVVTGGQAPVETTSSVRMHLVKVDDRWLVDEFGAL